MMEKKKNNEDEVQGYPLDRETKLMLLRWLKDGLIDRMEVYNLKTEVTRGISREEMIEELNRLELCRNDEICRHFISQNVCKYCHTDRTPREKPLPFYDEWESY